jgi:hypothetical protein
VSRHYSPRAVLRHLPLELLRRFLDLNSIATSPAWDALVEGDTAAVYRAWLDLPPPAREQTEQMLRQVHEMASHPGIRALIAEAAFRGRDIADALDPIPGLHAKALWVLTHHPPVFHTARLLLSAASPVGKYWNLTTGFEATPFDASETALRTLRVQLARLYREQGRGQRCTVEDFERNGCLYLFVYLDDYTQTQTAHNDQNRLVRSPVRPAFEVVYVYHREAGTLDMYAQGDRRWRACLRDLFCEHVLRSDPPAVSPSRRSYELNGLLRPDFRLPVDPARGILSASVRRLRVVHAPNPKRRVTLDGNPDGGPGELQVMLDQHFPPAAFPRSELLVNGAAFQVTFQLPGEDADRSLTFEVSFPDACNLKSMPDDRREVGEWCLRRWGILNDRPAD